MKKAYFISLIPLLLLSCLKTQGIEVEKRVNSLYNVDNINQLIVKGSDSLIVNELKFLVDGFSIITEDSIVIKKSEDIPALIFGYYEETTGDQLVFSVGLGFDGINNFNRYNVTINPVSRQSAITDSDFFESSNTFSIVIKGTYNSRDFIFRSSSSFFKEFSSEAVTLSNENSVLVITTKLDVEEIFVTNADILINPRDSSNTTQIENRFNESLNVEISKAKSPFF
ncbi:MAG: hypothetical protein ABJR05_11985 [Balneola sp.]